MDNHDDELDPAKLDRMQNILEAALDKANQNKKEAGELYDKMTRLMMDSSTPSVGLNALAIMLHVVATALSEEDKCSDSQRDAILKAASTLLDLVAGHLAIEQLKENPQGDKKKPNNKSVWG